MKVYVNRKPVEVLPGMKVKHALMASGLVKEMGDLRKVCDEWGNEIGLEGALSEEMVIYVNVAKEIR
jgi:hypothetical protein